MTLTNEIASKNVGRYIDLHKRMFGYYPMKIIKINDKLYVEDATKTCMLIEDSGFNSTDYDYIFEMIQGSEVNNNGL